MDTTVAGDEGVWDGCVDSQGSPDPGNVYRLTGNRSQVDRTHAQSGSKAKRRVEATLRQNSFRESLLGGERDQSRKAALLRAANFADADLG